MILQLLLQGGLRRLSPTPSTTPVQLVRERLRPIPATPVPPRQGPRRSVLHLVQGVGRRIRLLLTFRIVPQQQFITTR